MNHYHPVYKDLSCGTTDGIMCTNPKDINCPSCLENAKKQKEKPMDLALYQLHYEAFNKQFFPDSTLYDIESKMLEEMEELGEVISFENPIEERISEALDVMNMSIKLLTAYGVKNVLDAGYNKLMETKLKYEREGK